MAGIDNLNKRVDSLLASVAEPHARLIPCAGSRDALLARLQQAAQAAQDVSTDEVSPAQVERFKAMLAQSVRDTEQAYNVRFL